jgi:hypothetical protein
MRELGKNLLGYFACALVIVGSEVRAFAETPPSGRAAAARAFDEAVARYEHADYEGAAKAFLRADELAPSTDALHNAIAAARKANDHLLVATAAERAIARPSERQELVTEAREALAFAAKNLAQIDLGCSPLPCKLLVDGSPVPLGKRYVLPGAYSAVAIAEDGNRTEERLTLAAGVTYSVLLHASKAGESKEAAAVSTKAIADAADVPAKTDSTGNEARPSHPDAVRDVPHRHDEKPLSPPVFYAGVAVTAVLIGVTVWSGVDTLATKNDLPAAPHTADLDEVRSKEVRSNVIFASTVIVGAATIAAGLLWVDWGGGGGATAAVVPTSDGATIVARGRF